MDRRPPLAPRSRLLELRRDANQQVFTADRRHELNSDRYLATSPKVEGITGKYYANCKEKISNKESYDLDVAHRLWDVSARLTGVAG